MKPEARATDLQYAGSEQVRRKPIYLDGFNRPISEIVEGIRRDMATARGKLSDIGYAFPVWRDRLTEVEGLLTCGLVTLHLHREEMRAYEEKFPDAAQVPSPQPPMNR